MEENRLQLRRTVGKFILFIYLFFLVAAISAFFLVTELEKDNIVHDTQLVRAIVTIFFIGGWSAISYRLYSINMRVFDERSQVFDARETEHSAAKEAALLRDQFMANMSHEIRTPLNAIIGFGSMLARANLSGRERELSSNIQLASENLLAIVNDILDLSKIEAGMLVLEKVAFNPEGLFRTVKQLFLEKARQKKLSFDVHLIPTLPDYLVGDPTRLTQILTNLVGNALKFTERGGVMVSVEAIASDKKEQILLRIEVRDSGIGIPADKTEQVFERFTQTDEHTTRIYGGTGLGLSIVKQLVEAMNGTISLQSEVGKGSVFTLLLPFEQNAAEYSQVAPKDVEIPAQKSVDAPEIRILVVEDNPMNRRVIELLFEEWKYQYTIAQNGHEAIGYLEKDPSKFDLVLMDIQMPQMDGYEATELIRRKLGLDIPIIAMTAHALSGERQKCLNLGMNEYIAKPFREQELNQLIKQFTTKKETNGHQDATAVEIDHAYLQETTLGNLDFQRELAKIFLVQSKKDLSAIAAALSVSDLVAAAKAAHNMKSTVGYMGFAKNIGLQLKFFEEACREGRSIDRLQEDLAVIRELVSRANYQLQQDFVG